MICETRWPESLLESCSEDVNVDCLWRQESQARLSRFGRVIQIMGLVEILMDGIMRDALLNCSERSCSYESRN